MAFGDSDYPHVFSFDTEPEQASVELKSTNSVRYILFSFPFLFAIGLLAGASEEAILAFTSLFTQSLNYSERLGEIALVVAILGGAIGQLPLGWIIDRYERRLIWMGLFITMISSSVALIFFSHIL
ncbi:MAG: MFS transporter, partial [Thiolinea sp.]